MQATDMGKVYATEDDAVLFYLNSFDMYATNN